MPLKDTDIDRKALVRAAREARQHAYAPYSKYKVGAAVLAKDGMVYTGCNVENAAYPACICAERVAITKAVSEGKQEFLAVAVVTHNAGTPCGVCRQVINEFAPNALIIIADEERVAGAYTLSDLLPHGFGPHHLR